MRSRSLLTRTAVGASFAMAILTAAPSAAMAAGQVGPSQFVDDHDKPGAACVYSTGLPQRLTSFSVRAPSVWWWDTKASSDTQHGTVGWKIILQVSEAGAYGPWEVVARSSVQKATAYEDPNGAPGDPDGADDLDARAPFTRRAIAVDGSPWASVPNAHARVLVKAMWYRRDGSVAGSVKHSVFSYAWRNVANHTGGTTACPLKLDAA